MVNIEMIPTACPVCKQKSLTFEQDVIVCANCKAYRKPLNLLQKSVVWAKTRRLWGWRIIILAWFVFLLVQNWRNPSFAMNRFGNPFSALDLGIHELGHVLFAPFGEFMRIAGGSLFQCIFPLLWLVGFLQVRWYFAAAMSWCWLGLNLFDVAAYAADARARTLPLATGLAGLYEQGSDEVYDQAHDWYQLLSRTGNLQSDLAMAHFLRLAASIATFIGLILGLLLILNMFKHTASRQPTD